MNPELSFAERDTTAYIIEQLRPMGVRLQTPAATGVVATLEGNAPGTTVVIRADIDALPIHEENDVEYRSLKDGVMHACGHDGHAAILLGVADVLTKCGNRFSGTVKLLFQHAEELYPGGAQELIAAGALEGADFALGLHLVSHIPVGRAGIRAGPIQASSDTFTIEIEGKGGHGAYPHETVDATLVCAQLVVNLQTIVSRRVNPLQPAAVSVGQIRAGTANNVIAQRATLSGTVRTFDDETRSAIRREVQRIAEHTCGLTGAQCRVEYELGYPPLVNDAEISEVMRESAVSVLGESCVHEMAPSMGADDFAYYAKEVPAAFMFLGSGSPGYDFPHHHPRFDVDERSLEHGVAILTKAALTLLDR